MAVTAVISKKENFTNLIQHIFQFRFIGDELRCQNFELLLQRSEYIDLYLKKEENTTNDHRSGISE